MNDIRVVLVEDHDVVRIGLRTVLQLQAGIKVVGEASNGPQGLEMLEKNEIDVALVDIGLPGIDGIELTQQFRKFQQEREDSHTKVIMLTMQGNQDTVIAAFAAGADSYCMKDTGIEQLVDAIRTTHGGNAWIDPAIASIVLQQMKQGIDRPIRQKQTVEIRSLEPEYEQVLASDPVTDREREVLELMVAGCTNAIIAEKLFITVGTVKTHVRNILAKLCADDRTEAAVRALRSGIID